VVQPLITSIARGLKETPLSWIGVAFPPGDLKTRLEVKWVMSVKSFYVQSLVFQYRVEGDSRLVKSNEVG
jgi:hypothetical protein